MKILTTLVFVTLAATSLSAMDLGTSGISLNTTVDTTYNLEVDENNFNVSLEPELGYNWNSTNWTLGTDLNLYSNREIVIDESLDNIIVDFGVDYEIGSGMVVYGETTYNLEISEWDQSKVGFKLTF